MQASVCCGSEQKDYHVMSDVYNDMNDMKMHQLDA